MPLSESYRQDAEERLTAISPSLIDPYREALASLDPALPDEQVRLFSEEGIGLAAHSLRSWEAISDYYRAAPELVGTMDAAAFVSWAESGRRLAELASAIASAYFRSSPLVLPHLAGNQVQEWSALGERLYKATWKSISLSSEFFALSPMLINRISLAELGRFARILEAVSDRSADLAAACLDASFNVAASLDQAERLAFLDFASAIADSAWPEASLFFQRGPDLVNGIEPEERVAYLDLSTRVARRIGRQAYAYFAEGAQSLRNIGREQHGQLIDLAGDLVNLSPNAAMSFIKAAPLLVERLRPHELDQWHALGLDLLKQSVEGGEAYFRLESGRAETMLQSLSARVELSRVGDLLRLYAKALTGASLGVQPISALSDKGIGWVQERGPSTEGNSIFLPEFIEEYDNKPENFSVFKVYATHQTAHLEFGSFEFSFGAEGNVLPRQRNAVEQRRLSEIAAEAASVVTEEAQPERPHGWLTDMERFFDLFPDRQMGADIFTLVEDLRIDARIHVEYGGIRRPAGKVQEKELERRPNIRDLPLRQVFVENLVRASLDGESTIQFPRPLRRQLATALQTLATMRQTGAAVEDASEATIILYDIAAAIPNLPPELLKDLDWDEMTDELLQQLMGMSGEEGDEGDGLDELPEGDEEGYGSPGEVGFRGDFKPELVQLLKRMKGEKGPDEDNELVALTPEQIKELLEKSVEVETDMNDMDMLATLGAFLDSLEDHEEQDGDADDDDAPEADPPPPSPAEAEIFYYDEWDFRATDYKPRWCIVRQRPMEEGTEEYFEKTLREHAGLSNETQRQFEQLKPETFRKIKRLEDGEEVDLDHAIDFLAQKKAGHGDIAKIFWRRNKIERDVAVAFLIDMSASTDEEIEKRKPRRDENVDASDPRRYYQWLAQNRSQQLSEPPKRIIDLEKESLVLLTRALEAIGDRYGIYGFSGYGRENVEYFVIKDLDETFGDVTRRRIDKVTPIRSTRMGPAIRHTTAKLLETDAKARILFLVSDGRPQDHGYGRDRTEKEYAIHDTHKALIEAKHKGIVPFALTVDKEGHDYLGQMCGDMAYEVLGDIELLPSRLPTLYRMLTE